MRRSGPWLLSFAVLGEFIGCSGSVRSGSADSRTGGVAIDLLRTDRTSSHALYRVEPEGTISFGGGMDALRDRTTWTGELTDEQIASLRTLLAEHGWFERPPEAGGSREPEEETRFEHRIRFASPERSWRVTILGGGGRLDPIVDFLKQASLQRHERFLEQLPQPTQPQQNGD